MIKINKFSHFLVVFITIILVLINSIKLCSQKENSIIIKISNPSKLERKNELIKISDLKINFDSLKSINKSLFIFDGDSLVDYAIVKEGNICSINILTNLKPLQKKTYQILIADIDKYTIPELKPRTKSHLGIKTDYTLINNIYTNGYFKPMNNILIKNDHFPHDCFIQYEGPGWESERIAYRFYLDERNRNDIFGKQTNRLVIDSIGINDLVSDGKESYTSLQPWGMDIFKVSNSLGIGSIATYYNNKVFTISQTDSIFCSIYNSAYESSVETNYYGWKYDNSKVNITSRLSIVADSRLTKCEVNTDIPLENICTGLAKHKETSLIKISDSSKYSWSCIALWGKQSLAGDNLGIALFYKNRNLISLTEDDINELVLLKPYGNKLQYYFAAAWENEYNGIKTEKEFKKFLHDEIEKLSYPIVIKHVTQ